MIGAHTFTLGVPKDYTPGSRKRKVAGTTVGTPLTITFARIVTALLLACLVPGCAHHFVNAPLKTQDPQAGYRFETTPHAGNSDELFVILAFSGGGTRAAALSYGALAELRDTTLTIGGRKRRLLDERELAPREFTYATAGKSYIDGTPKKKSRPYIHLLDGGLSANIGRHGPAYVMTSAQNLWSMKRRLNTKIKPLVVITVHAKTDSPSPWDRKKNAPGVLGMLSVGTTKPCSISPTISHPPGRTKRSRRSLRSSPVAPHRS